MSTNADVRRSNLERLVLEFGTLERVAELGKTSPVYLSQVRAASKDHRGTARSMGTVVARKLEVGCDKPSGWMDTPSPALLAAGVAASKSSGSAPTAMPAPHGKVVAWDKPGDLSPDWVLVDRRSIKLSAGNGTVVFEHEQLPPLAFRDEYLREKRVRNRNNLVICYAEGDSMEPSFRDRDVLLCDTGQTEIIDGEVYALDYGGELRVKRLRKPEVD